MLSTTSSLCPENESEWSINKCRRSLFENQQAVQPRCSVIELSAAFLNKSACNNIVSRFYNERQRSVNAMSHRSHFFACTSRVNIYKPAICCTITLLSAVARIVLPIILIHTAMSDSKSLNTSMLEVMISSKNEHVFGQDLTDLSLQIIFDAWWASMNAPSKRPIAWNNSRHAASWRFYLHCGIEENGRPGIICIVCHQVLSHLSEHGTSSMEKHLLAKAHIAKLNELTE